MMGLHAMEWLMSMVLMGLFIRHMSLVLVWMLLMQFIDCMLEMGFAHWSRTRVWHRTSRLGPTPTLLRPFHITMLLIPHLTPTLRGGIGLSNPRVRIMALKISSFTHHTAPSSLLVPLRHSISANGIIAFFFVWRVHRFAKLFLWNFLALWNAHLPMEFTFLPTWMKVLSSIAYHRMLSYLDSKALNECGNAIARFRGRRLAAPSQCQTGRPNTPRADSKSGQIVAPRMASGTNRLHTTMPSANFSNATLTTGS
jgi:hypothetical protein